MDDDLNQLKTYMKTLENRIKELEHKGSHPVATTCSSYAHPVAWQAQLISERDSEELVTVVDEFITANREAGTVKRSDRSQAENTEIRVSDIAWYDPYEDYDSEACKILLRAYLSMVGLAHISASSSVFRPLGIRLDSSPREKLQLTRYCDGGYYRPHPDRSDADLRTHGRQLSMSVPLNPHTTRGGRLVFKDLPATTQNQVDNELSFPGSAVVFPSEAIHEVEPLKTPEVPRYSLVMWFSGTRNYGNG